MKWPNIKYKIGENHLCRSVFFVTQISQMRPVRSLQIPPEVEKSPTDFTDLHRFFLRRFFVTQISQMRPVRSLQIPPEVGKSPTDFTDIHRFFLGCFFVTQISQMTQIFFLMGFFFIGFHGNYSEVDCWDDYARIFADATCTVVADTPWDWTKRFNRESIKNLCISVKSVGQNNPHEEKSASSAKSAWQKQQEQV